jgi:hypothetical protein
MSSSESLENLNKTIITKIDILKYLCIETKLNNMLKVLNEVYDIYLISVIDIIINYYNLYNDVNNIYKCTITYKNRIDNINIINKIELIFNCVNEYINNNDLLTDKIKIKIFHFNNNIIYSQITNNTSIDYCLCVNTDKIDINQHELVCSFCGKIYPNNNNTMHNNNDDKQSTKYDFLRHYRIWLDKILATDNKYLVKYENDITLLEKKIYIDYPLEQQRNKLNISHIRVYLKNSNLTKLNDIVPILLKRITKHNPPQLNAKEYFDLENLFIQIMKVYDTIKKNDEINRKYYPYFIYKLIEYYFRNNPEKQKLLNNIHLQKKKTLVNNDLKWKSICERLPHILKYQETIDKLY